MNAKEQHEALDAKVEGINPDLYLQHVTLGKLGDQFVLTEDDDDDGGMIGVALSVKDAERCVVELGDKLDVLAWDHWATHRQG